MNYRFYLIIIFLIGAVAIGFFLSWPKFQKVLSIQSDIDRVNSDIAKGEEYYAELEKIDERLDQYQDQIKIIETTLPKKVYLPHIHDFFQKFSNREKMVLTNVGANIVPIPDSKVKEIAINLKVGGTYDELKQFISSLRSSIRFFGISYLSFSTAEEGEPFGFGINLRTFSY